MRTFLSLGAGVQSSTMALMAANGELQYEPECAIFADTQWEPSFVYEWLDWLETQLPFPVYRVTAGSLRDAIINNDFVPIPAYTENKGIGRRQCTREYKLAPIFKKQRELLGYKPYQRIKGVQCQTLIGISLDESSRMRTSRQPWNVNVYPLVELGMTRADCLNWLKEKKYPIPPKSSCVGCPFRNKESWESIYQSPKDWQDAVLVDEAIRHKSEYKQFLHYSKKPLQIALQDQNSHIQLDLDLFNMECEGMCGL